MTDKIKVIVEALRPLEILSHFAARSKVIALAMAMASQIDGNIALIFPGYERKCDKNPILGFNASWRAASNQGIQRGGYHADNDQRPGIVRLPGCNHRALIPIGVLAENEFWMRAYYERLHYFSSVDDLVNAS